MSGNQDHFDVVTRAAGYVRSRFGTRIEHGDYVGRVRDAAIRANGGRHDDMVDRIVAYQTEKVGRGIVNTPKGPMVGQGCHAARPARFYADRAMRGETFFRVGEIVRAARAEGASIPSVHAMRRAFVEDGHRASVAAVRSAFREYPEGLPPVVERNRRRLSRPARDLVAAFEEAFPRSAVHRTSVRECLRKLYVPSANPNTQRSHAKRIAAVLAEIEAALEIGISIRRVEGVVFVGRGRAVPDNAYRWMRETPHRHIDLTPGLASGRAGLWSTPEGRMARDLVEVTQDFGDRYVSRDLAALLGPDQASSDDLARLEETAEGMAWSARNGVLGARQMELGARDRLAQAEMARKGIDAAIERIAVVYERAGLVGLWEAARTWPGLKAKAGDLAARRRIARIAERFAEVQCPCKIIEGERFARALWLETPKALRSPEPPPVRDYVPVVPRPRKIRDLARTMAALRRAAEPSRWKSMPARSAFSMNFQPLGLVSRG